MSSEAATARECIARGEAAFARGDIEAALAAVEDAAAVLDDSEPGDAARLAWLAASISLISGDIDGFIETALAAIEHAPDAMLGELTAMVREVAGTVATASPLLTVAVRFDLGARELVALASGGRLGDAAARARLEDDRLLAPAVQRFLAGQPRAELIAVGEVLDRPLGSSRALVIDGGDDVAREVVEATGRAGLWIEAAADRDAALDAVRDARLHDAVLVVRDVPPWLDDVARRPVLVVVVAAHVQCGRALAMLRPLRGAVELWRDPPARPARRWAPLSPELEALLTIDDGGIPLDRAGERGRVAVVSGAAATQGEIAADVAARAGLPWWRVDVAIDGLAAARDALTAGAAVVLLVGTGDIDPVAAAALRAAVGGSEAITLIAAPTSLL